MTDSLATIQKLTDTPSVETIYRCENGDCWELVSDARTGCRMVRHTPNAASGGAPRMVSVEEFLALHSSGPQHAALRILLTGLCPKPDPSGVA